MVHRAKAQASSHEGHFQRCCSLEVIGQKMPRRPASCPHKLSAYPDDTLVSKPSSLLELWLER